jgi:excisionase family DNA binding protein
MTENSPRPLPDVLTVAEVAQQLRVSKMTIYRMINSGELRALRIGRSVRVPAAALAELLDTLHHHSTAPQSLHPRPQPPL